MAGETRRWGRGGGRVSGWCFVVAVGRREGAGKRNLFVPSRRTCACVCVYTATRLTTLPPLPRSCRTPTPSLPCPSSSAHLPCPHLPLGALGPFVLFSLTHLPPLPAATLRTAAWRNGLVFNPNKAYGGLSYAQVRGLGGGRKYLTPIPI